jgi:hypothetical protein
LSLRIRVPRRRGQKSFWGWACSVLSNVLCRARVRSFERIPDRAFSVPAYSHYTVPFLRFKTAAIFHSATNCCFVFEQNKKNEDHDNRSLCSKQHQRNITLDSALKSSYMPLACLCLSLVSPALCVDLKCPVVTICTTMFNIQQFYVLPTHLCVLCGSQNKQRLFHCTTLTDWFV